MSRTRRARAGRAALAATVATLVAAAAAACSVDGGTDDQADAGTGGDRTVTLLTHDSWAMPDRVVEAFEHESGYRLRVVTNGDAGELTNKLVLTKAHPLGDAVYGIDNTFASRAVDAGVLAPYTSSAAPRSADRYALRGDAAERLTPVDWGDVCVNVDDRWFAAHGLEEPRTLDDLADPAYRDLLVTPAPSTSSPGFAFLLATIARYGEDGWQDYWRRLLANGAKVVQGWNDAYEVDFTAGSGHGDRPVVVSYNSSPPFTIPRGGHRPTTSALLDTCFRQVEYAGVLAGAENPDGARALVDFMEGRQFQQALPDNMYVFPVDSAAKLPRLWARWAEPARHPFTVPPSEVAAHRSEWLRRWSDLAAS